MPAARTCARLGVTGGLVLTLVAGTTPSAHALTREIGPSDGASGDRFGTSLAMDGNTLVVGAPGKGAGQGAVYVYNRAAGENWTQAAKLTASDGAPGDGLGASVAIDGDVIVAGASGDNGAAGSLYVFNRTAPTTWSQGDHLLAADQSAGDTLGAAVAIDGDVIVAGAPGWDDAEAYDAGYGAVYTFDTVGVPGRFQTARLTASDNDITGYYFAGSALGSSVAIDGDTIVAGAPSDLFGSVSNNRRGSVYTFSRTGADPTREETAKLTVTGQTSGRVGGSVDIEGDLIVAGDVEADSAFGAAWLFSRTGANPRHQVGKLTPANPSQSKQFGQSVSISSSFIAVGAQSYNTGGAGFVFTRTGAPDRTETWYTSGSPQSGAELYGASILTDGDRVVGGAPDRDMVSPTRDQQGLAYSSTPSLFATSIGTGTGTISSSTGGISSCASSCSEDLLLGDQTTLTATPNPGSHFAGWESYSGCSGTGTCLVTMDGAPQVAARFTLGSAPGGDTTAPTVTISSGPATGSTITTASAMFGFSANENVTFQCAVDGGAYGACTSTTATSGTHQLSGLVEGAHVFRVKATDTSGNASAEQTRSFTVDLPEPSTPPPAPPGDSTAPQTTVTKAPPKKVFTSKKKAKIAIEMSASESSTFLCKVDDAGYKPCGSPFKVTLGLGKHTILLVAVDAAGNRDTTPARVVVKVRKKKD